MLPPEVAGRQRKAGLGLPLAPHVVGREHGVERAEAGAPSHVAREAVVEAHAVGALVVEEAAAEEQVAGGADGRGGAGVAHQCAVLVVEVDAVGIDGPLAHQAEAVVHGEVAAGLGKEFERPADLVAVLGHVRLDPYIGIPGRQLSGTAQLRLAATGGEARRDRVAQPAAAVPAADEVFGVGERPGGLVAHAVGGVPVLQHLAGDEAHAARGGLFHQRIHRRGMGGGEGERRGDAVAQQLVDEDGGDAPGIACVGEARFVREGVVFQPGQQPFRRRADDIGLREMHVHVHEAGRDDAAGGVRDRQAGEAGRERAPVARGDHALHAVRTGTDGEQAVFVVEREAFCVEAQQRGPVNVGGGVRGRGQGRRWHAGMMTWRPCAGAQSGR